MKTAEQVKKEFRLRGETVPMWAKRHGFKVSAVRNAIYGKSKGRWGDSHKIAVMLGLKEGEIAE